MGRLLKVTLKVGTAVALAAFLVAAVSGWSDSREIFVNANAAPGGDGKTPSRAYRTIRAAVDDVNERPDNHDYTIRIAQGTYLETPDITITRDGVRLLGSTTLIRDGSGLPTGAYEHGVKVRPAVPLSTLVPGNALIQVNASRVEIAGLVLDGGAPRPPLGPGITGLLLMVDGVPSAPLQDIFIHDNIVIDTPAAVLVRLSSVDVTGNFFARSNLGLLALSGFEHFGHPELESHFFISGNRFVEHQNIALNVVGSMGAALTPIFTAGPSVGHVTITHNDFLRNSNGPAYPQPVQYSAVNFNPMNSGNSDPRQPTRIYADIRHNRFVENGYGLSVSQRVATTETEAAYSFEGRLFGNSYCGNGLNDAFFNFNLNAQSHGFAAGGVFRYATNSTYVIDATGDGLTTAGFDYDHPLLDPRMPLSAPGTLVLTNLLTFNGAIVPNAVQLTRPPLLSQGPPPVFGPIDVGLTPSLSLVGPDRIFVNRGGSFVDPGTIAIDPCEGDLSDKVITSGTVDVTTPGTYVLTYEVTNAVGKSAPPVERTVVVRGRK